MQPDLTTQDRRAKRIHDAEDPRTKCIQAALVSCPEGENKVRHINTALKAGGYGDDLVTGHELSVLGIRLTGD